MQEFHLFKFKNNETDITFKTLFNKCYGYFMVAAII